MEKEVENLDDHGCPVVLDVVDEETWIWSKYQSRHKTRQYGAERKTEMFGN